VAELVDSVRRGDGPDQVSQGRRPRVVQRHATFHGPAANGDVVELRGPVAVDGPAEDSRFVVGGLNGFSGQGGARQDRILEWQQITTFVPDSETVCTAP